MSGRGNGPSFDELLALVREHAIATHRAQRHDGGPDYYGSARQLGASPDEAETIHNTLADRDAVRAGRDTMTVDRRGNSYPRPR